MPDIWRMVMPDIVDKPEPSSVAIMMHIDAMTKPQRRLVHEYGYAKVCHLMQEGYSRAPEMQRALEQWRAQRQAEWLMTNYMKRNADRH